jgi:hypothetical protein
MNSMAVPSEPVVEEQVAETKVKVKPTDGATAKIQDFILGKSGRPSGYCGMKVVKVFGDETYDAYRVNVYTRGQSGLLWDRKLVASYFLHVYKSGTIEDKSKI